MIARRKVLLEYENRLHDRTRRVVDPWGLIDKNGAWYLVAGTETGQRTFRVSYPPGEHDRPRGPAVQ
ncbi:MAG TPA: WYL domain-containing protein [Dermatophilaceae bacterium]|nr:WYL domain-containing protein [Dermatophilaceae bacterium]